MHADFQSTSPCPAPSAVANTSPLLSGWLLVQGGCQSLSLYILKTRSEGMLSEKRKKMINLHINSNVHASSWSSGYCLCGISPPPVSVCLSAVLSVFLPPTKNMLVDGLAILKLSLRCK